MTVFVCGNSHVAALAAQPDPAVTIFPFGNGRHETEVFSEPVADGVRLLPEQYAANVARHTGSPVLSTGHTWGLLTVNHNARVYRHKMWRTSAPWQLAVDGVTPVSDDLLVAMIERDQRGSRLLFDHALAAGLDVFAVSAPHPRRDGHAAANGVPLDVIAHIDRVARETWQAWLDERRIAVVQPPPETVDDDGLLKAEYGATELASGTKDPHHANDAYGALMMARIRQHLSER